MDAYSANAPRWGDNGLWIESKSTNRLTYSEQLDHANWIKSGVTVTPDTDQSPFRVSTISADSVHCDGSQLGYMEQTVAAPSDGSGNTVNLSVYIKKFTNSETHFPAIEVTTPDNVTVYRAIINANTGVISSYNLPNTGDIIPTIESRGNYWYVQLIGTGDATGIKIRLYPAYNSDGSTISIPTAGTTVFTCVQASSVLTAPTYQRSISNQETRNLDDATVNVTNLSSLSTVGTIFIHAKLPTLQTYHMYLVSINDPNKNAYGACYARYNDSLDTTDVFMVEDDGVYAETLLKSFAGKLSTLKITIGWYHLYDPGSGNNLNNIWRLAVNGQSVNGSHTLEFLNTNYSILRLGNVPSPPSNPPEDTYSVLQGQIIQCYVYDSYLSQTNAETLTTL